MATNKKLPSPHKIALYVRVSTEEQASNPEGSMKSQEQSQGKTPIAQNCKSS